MKTDDLINMLAADTQRQHGVAHRLARALPAGLFACAIAFLIWWGPRADLGAVLGSGVVLKTLGPVVVAGLAAAALLVLVQPGRSAGLRLAGLGLVIAVAAAVLAALVARAGPGALGNALATPSLLVCLVSIPLLAMPVLAAVIWAATAGATLRPGLTGGVAGVVAGAAAGAVYSLYCTQDGGLFVLPAYGFAILNVALAGVLAGRRYLAW